MILADLLKIPCLSTSRVIAGEEGLNRIVYSVNMMDAPDIIDFFKTSGAAANHGICHKGSSGSTGISGLQYGQCRLRRTHDQDEALFTGNPYSCCRSRQ